MSASRGRANLDLEFDLVPEAPIPVGFSGELASELAGFVLRAEGESGAWSIAVALVTDDRMRILHRDFMSIDEPTDIMTFPAELPGAGGGDIVISVDRAAEQGPEHGNSAGRETLYLIAHGLLHLCGWDDATPEERGAMLARQQALIEAFERERADR